MYCTVRVLCHMTVMVQLLEKEIVSWHFRDLDKCTMWKNTEFLSLLDFEGKRLGGPWLCLGHS